MVVILQDRRLQHLFLFKGGEIERRRLDYWLSVAIVEAQEDGTLGELLKVCAEFVEFTKECPECLDGLLRGYLKSWNGVDNRESVFDLLTCIIPVNYDGVTLSCLVI